MTNNNHLSIFASISFLAILFIIIFTPKANVVIDPTYLSASTTSFSAELLEY